MVVRRSPALDQQGNDRWIDPLMVITYFRTRRIFARRVRLTNQEKTRFEMSAKRFRPCEFIDPIPGQVVPFPLIGQVTPDEVGAIPYLNI
jgi:hypothetical protein